MVGSQHKGLRHTAQIHIPMIERGHNGQQLFLGSAIITLSNIQGFAVISQDSFRDTLHLVKNCTYGNVTGVGVNDQLPMALYSTQGGEGGKRAAEVIKRVLLLNAPFERSVFSCKKV